MSGEKQKKKKKRKGAKTEPKQAQTGPKGPRPATLGPATLGGPGHKNAPETPRFRRFSPFLRALKLLPLGLSEFPTFEASKPLASVEITDQSSKASETNIDR